METKRTKEELIAAQRGANEAQADGTEIYDQATAPAMRGDAAGALKALAWQAGRLWELGALGGFDLRRVDERGFLLDAGEVEVREQHAGGLPGREVTTWQAGEHLDDVLRRGAARVQELAREALEKPAALPESVVREVYTLKPGELLVLEADPKGLRGDAHERLLRALDEALRPMNATAVLLEGPVRRESVEHLRNALREVGYDVVSKGLRDATLEVTQALRVLFATAAAPALAEEQREAFSQAVESLFERVSARASTVEANVVLDGRALHSAANTIATFADLLAAKKPALVAVLEPDHDRCVRLLEHLFALGGAKANPLPVGGDRVVFGPITIWVAHFAAQAKDWSRGWDVAVGFDARTAADLVDGSPIRLAIAPEDAPRFWGMA